MGIEVKPKNPFVAVRQKVLEVAGKAQEKLFEGKFGDVMAGDRSDFTEKLISKTGLTAFKEAPPPPTLKRPVVMITGLTMQAASYDPMAKHLAKNPANGKEAVYVAAEGQFRQGSATGPVMTPAQVKGSKMFQIQYTNVMGAPSEKAPQIAKAMAAIQKATQAGELDVVAHSAGCTDFRLYLDSRSQTEKDQVKVNQAVFIGPATRGTFMGNIGDAVGGVAGVEKAGQELALGSKLVEDLNARWEGQRGQVKGATIIGISGAPTPGPGGISTGDGFMPVRDLPLPNSELVVLKGSDPTPVAHLAEVAYSGVIAEVQSRLAR